MEAFSDWLKNRVDESRRRDRDQLRGMGLDPKGMTIGPATKYDTADTLAGPETGGRVANMQDDPETKRHAVAIFKILSRHGYEIDMETAYGMAQLYSQSNRDHPGAALPGVPGAERMQPGRYSAMSGRYSLEDTPDTIDKKTRDMLSTTKSYLSRGARRGDEEE